MKQKIDQEIGRLAQDPDRAEAEVQHIRTSFAGYYKAIGGRQSGSPMRGIRAVARNAASLYEMLADPGFAVPVVTKAAIIFALGYFISPVDVIPDVIPVAGYLDDAFVVGHVVSRICGVIAKYRQSRGGGAKHVVA